MRKIYNLILILFLFINESFSQIDISNINQFAILTNGNILYNSSTTSRGNISSNGNFSSSNIYQDTIKYNDFSIYNQLINNLKYQFSNSNNQISLDSTFQINVPGNYIFNQDTLKINDNSLITLSGNIQDIYIINLSGNLHIGKNVKFTLDGIKPNNIYWNINGSVLIDQGSEVYGLIFSNDVIELNNGVSGLISLYSNSNIEISETNALHSPALMNTPGNYIKNPEFYPPGQGIICNLGTISTDVNSTSSRHWINPVIGGSPDYYHYFCQNMVNGIPTNFNGSQAPPFLGVGYAGIITSLPGSNFTEYIQSQLVEPLIAGHVYKLEMYVSLADKSTLSTSDIGAYFSNNPISQNSAINGYYLTVTPQIKNFCTITNTGIWYNIQAYYTAIGGEQYITIGRFNDGNLRPTTQVNQLDASGTNSHSNYVSYFYFGAINLLPIIGNPPPLNPPQYHIANAGADRIYCQSNSNHTITLGGPISTTCLPDAIFSWSPSVGLSSSSEPNPIATPLSTTTYTLTVTAGPFVTTDQVTITVPPIIDLGTEINPETQYIKDNTPTLINSRYNLNGLTNQYEYEWQSADGSSLSVFDNVNILNPTVSIISPGTYKYRLIVKSGECFRNINRTFVVVGPPETPNFKISNTKNCDVESVNIFFVEHPRSTDIYTYSWDFGNGTQGNGISVNPDFSYGGSFIIKLTITDLWGRSSSFSKVSEFIPSYFEYNNACCSENSNLYIGNTNSVDGDLHINTNTHWSSSRKIKGIITIQTGNELKISSSTVISFGMNGKIIIEPGAKLILESGTVLQGIETCNTMWQGVEVWGNQSISHIGFSNQNLQGKLVMKSGATIKNAHKAIFVGKKNSCVPGFDCNTVRGVQTYEVGYGGGIIDIQNSNFVNNAINIEFAPHIPLNGGLYNYNASIIKDNNFDGGILLDPAYNTSIGVAPNYPNNNNYYYSDANSDGKTSMHLKTYNIYNLKVEGNNFEGAENGIFSIDSRLTISKGIGNGNVFSNLDYGIHALFTGTTFDNSHTISHNNFNKMKIAGIRMDGGRYVTINNNMFGQQPTESNQNDNPLAIYLAGSGNFKINDNTFYRVGEGIRILESDAAGGVVSTNNGTGNLFINNAKGIVSSGYNPNLVLRCNIHTNGNASEYISENWNIDGVLSDQGSHEDHTKPAGNEFHPPDKKEILSSTPFWYYAHARAADNTFATIPSAALNSTWTESYIQNTGFVKQNNSCLPPPPCVPSCDIALQNNQDWRDYLEQHYDEVMQNIDAGQTQEMLSALNDFTLNSNQLKEMFIENSPLSETIILGMLNNSNRFNVIDFMSILESNLPVSPEFWDTHFVPILSTLDTGVSTLLKTYQLSENYETLASLEIEYQNALNEQQQLLEEMVLHEVEIDPNATAILLTSQENENKRMAASSYLLRGNTADASILIQELTNEGITSDWTDIVNYKLNLVVNEQEWSDLEETYKNRIEDIAENSNDITSKLNAQAISTLLNLNKYPMLEQSSSFNRSTNKLSKKLNFQNINKSDVRVFPNPANNKVYLNSIKPFKLVIANSIGQIFMNKYIESTNSNIEIETSDLPNGVYLFNFIYPDGKSNICKVVIHH